MQGALTDIESLKLFNQKALKLQQSNFVQTLVAAPPSLKLKGQKLENGTFSLSAEARGPTQESTEAFVLTFRFFIQDNEVTSFRNMAALYDRAPLTQEFRHRFNSAREAVNELLDRPNLVNISHNNETPTNRRVLNVFVYGGLAHANSEAYGVYNDWMSFPPSAVFFQTCFTSILASIIEAIVFIARLNDEAIDYLSTTQASLPAQGLSA